MKRMMLLVIAVAAVLFTTPLFAANLDASAVLTSKADGSNFDYSITLTNLAASPAGIGTFWFAWVPGQDYLATSPFNIQAPTGWTDMVTHGGSSDGFAIQFVAGNSTPLLMPGNSLSGFTFSSTDTPSELAGNSLFFNHPPVTTSFVYDGPPFSSISEQFVVSVQSAVPEPSSLVLGLFAVVTSIGYARVTRGKKATSSVIN